MREDQTECETGYLLGPHQYPELTEFRYILGKFNTKLVILANRLMRLALLSASVTEISVICSFVKPTTWLSLLHYPTIPSSRPDDLYSAIPHTHFGCLTISVQDDIGGL